MRRLLMTILASTMLWMAPATAVSADHPVEGTQLTLRKRLANEVFTLVLRDPSIPVPAAGSADDPSRSHVRVTLFARGPGEQATFSTYELPELWNVRTTPRAVSYGYRDKTATRFGGELRTVNLRTGGGLKLSAKSTGFGSTLLDAVAVRVEYGSTRVCALFDGTSVRRNWQGEFQARNADAAGLADCNDWTLAGLPPPTPTPPLPTPTPPSAVTCCACGCAPPYYLNCPFSQHQCTRPVPIGTTSEQCASYSIPGQLSCSFIAACNSYSGPFWMPLCTGL